MESPIYKLEKVVQGKEELQDFEGPLDLILFLLSKNKIEIQDIPIALILDQYLAYLDRRKEMDLEVASEFVTMAAHLMYIKTRMLLSLEDEEAKNEMDALIQSLAERQRGEAYARIRRLAELLGPMGEFGRSILTRDPEPMERGKVYEYDQQPADLVIAMQEVTDRRGQAETPPLRAFDEIVRREPYSVEQKAKEIVRRLKEGGITRFLLLFRGSRSRSELVATFMAVLELCRTRLPDNMHIPADQIQVLTPTRKGPCGTMNLNRLLQEALNPKAPGKREILWGERVFRVGDRIMQTRNDYGVVWEKADGTVGTGMFNGDVGRIAEIDAGGEWLALDFDGRKAPYSVEMLSEIDLAYAQTVHKAQGSEYRCVVLAALPSAPSLMVRGVLYTALTRARELLVIVGDDAAIRSMAANDRQQKRYSGLKWRLCHAGDANGE